MSPINTWRALLAAILFAAASGSAAAHFSAGTKIRTIVVAESDGELVAYVRAPAPLLFSDVITSAQASGGIQTPFLYAESVTGAVRFRISLAAVEEFDAAWADRLADSLVWTQNGRQVTAKLREWRVAASVPDTLFATVPGAAESLAQPGAAQDPVFGEAVVEYVLALDAPLAAGSIAVRSGLPELPLVAGVDIDNHLVDGRQDPPRSLTSAGQLLNPVLIDGSWLRTVLAFTWQGVIHILVGLDHVLLVVCFALAIGLVQRLIWVVTAFTLGHSVTLVATVLGATPTWPWFISAVETAIAATVLYASITAWRHRLGPTWIMAGIGLLHGLGFSFVLGDILGEDAPDLVSALAAFNAGVEIGQMAILAATIAVTWAIAQMSAKALVFARHATLAGVATVAAYWVVERTLQVV